MPAVGEMIGSISRSVGAVVVGFIPAMILIIGVEVVSDRLYPFPPGVDPSDMEVCRAHVAKLPAGIFLMAVVGWGVGLIVTHIFTNGMATLGSKVGGGCWFLRGYCCGTGIEVVGRDATLAGGGLANCSGKEEQNLRCGRRRAGAMRSVAGARMWSWELSFGIRKCGPRRNSTTVNWAINAGTSD
jgi:hypothetical protein